MHCGAFCSALFGKCKIDKILLWLKLNNDALGMGE
jgi:hypothetical protein